MLAPLLCTRCTFNILTELGIEVSDTDLNHDTSHELHLSVSYGVLRGIQETGWLTVAHIQVTMGELDTSVLMSCTDESRLLFLVAPGKKAMPFMFRPARGDAGYECRYLLKPAPLTEEMSLAC